MEKLEITARDAFGQRFIGRSIRAFALGTLTLATAATALADSGAAAFADRIAFSGRIHPQFDFLESRLSGVGLPDPDRSERVFIRRVFAGMKFDLNDRVALNYLTDFSEWEIKNQIARIEWQIDDKSQLRLGYEKVSFGYEEQMSSSRVKPIERSVSTRFWSEVVKLGSYHSGLFYTRKFSRGYESTVAVTHNVASESDWPDVLDGEASSYLRVQKKGKIGGESTYTHGLDLAYQPSGHNGDALGAALYSDWQIGRYGAVAEAIAGEVDLPAGERARSWGGYGQVSRMFGAKIEGVVRVTWLDTGGFGGRLATLIRKAPNSGIQYDRVENLYVGFNYYIKGNDLKLSAGYELGEGRSPVRDSASLVGATETVAGFRLRGQFMF